MHHAGHAPHNPALAEHILLPVLHILLDAMGASTPRGKDRGPRYSPGATDAAAQSPGDSTSARSPAEAGSGAAAPVAAPRPAAGAEAAPVSESQQGASPDRQVPAEATGSGEDAPRPRVLVSFSDFMSGRAGLADYLARRASGGVPAARPAATGEDSRVQQLVLRRERHRL